MSVFLPVKAYRPSPDLAAAISCRPYDVINREEARKESKENPTSFYAVIKPEIQFPASVDEHDPAIYRRGKENFDRLIQSNVFSRDSKPGFYIYQLEMDGHIQSGLVGACSINDYLSNVIKKHELTRPDKEEDRKNHIRVSKMHYEPVFFAYKKEKSIDAIVNDAIQTNPDTSFVSADGIRHTIWKIEKAEIIKQVSSLFESNVPAIYIADGHHRTAAAVHVGQEFLAQDSHEPLSSGYSHFLAVLFPDDQLQILDYNRVVKDLNGNSSEEFLAKIKENFLVEPVTGSYKPEKPNTFGLYLPGQWYALKTKEASFDATDPIGQLDVSILSKNILEPILGIKDLRTDNRIDFVGGINGMEGLEKRVNSGEMKAAFSLFPVSMDQLFRVSDNDLLMPPKVTWFEPKLRSGLFVYSLENSME